MLNHKPVRAVCCYKRTVACCVFLLGFCNAVAKLGHAQGSHSPLKIQKVAALPNALLESSGLVWVKGLLWTMSDQTDPRLYALSPVTGKVVRRVFLKGVRNRDWESLAADRRYFYVGDIGNNDGKRQTLTVYRFALKRLSQQSIRVRDRFVYRYPQNKPAMNRAWFHDYDAEAMMSLHRRLYVFTKNWRRGNTDLYRLSANPAVSIATRLHAIKVTGMVTAVDHFEHRVLLMSYRLPLLGFHVYLTQATLPALLSSARPDLTSFYLSLHCQAEGLALHNKQVWITCEGRPGIKPAALYRLTLPPV